MAFRVFISSTAEDLVDYIAVAREVIEAHQDLLCDQFQRWPSTGRLPVSLCMERVNEADAVIVIAGFRYGWIPTKEEDGDGFRSITRMEVETARLNLKPVLPFVIVRRSGETEGVGEADPATRALLEEFRGGLMKTAGRLVDSADSFRTAILDSLPYLCEKLSSQQRSRSQPHFFVFGKQVQGTFTTFRDRTLFQQQVRDALTGDRYRGVCIVGKGGYGKSALANHTVERLSDGKIDGVLHLSAEGGEQITLYNLFKGTMQAAGNDPISYDGSWRALSQNLPELTARLLSCFQNQRILINCDGFEAKLDRTGAIQDESLASFLGSFLIKSHRSRILITSRMPVRISTDADKFLLPIPLDEGLPADEAEDLVKDLATGRFVFDEDQLRRFVARVEGVPFLLERLYDLRAEDYLLDLDGTPVQEDILKTLVHRVHSRLNENGRAVLHALSIFDEAVSLQALQHVLAPYLGDAAVRTGLEEVVRARLSFNVAGTPKFSLHRMDKDASYTSIGESKTYSREALHRQAADFYDRGCQDRPYWYQWESRDELDQCLLKFKQLRKAGDDAGAALSMSISKVEFLNWSGHVREIQEMFRELKVDASTPQALLIKNYALADALVVLGPFDQAVRDFKPVVELARSLRDSITEAAALYESGLAARYSGDGQGAVELIAQSLSLFRQSGDEERLAYYLYGYSLACAYAGRDAEAIRAGLDQVSFGEKQGNAYFVARGDSSLCLPLYVIGMPHQAAGRARRSAEAFRVRHRYHLGFIENVLGLALLELGDLESAKAAFEQARKSGAAEAQTRVEGLATFNLAWLHYTQAQFGEAVQFATLASQALGVGDRKAVELLRVAIASASSAQRDKEASALLGLSRETANLDLVRRATVAQRAALVAGEGSSLVLEAKVVLTAAERTFDNIAADLGQSVMQTLRQ